MYQYKLEEDGNPLFSFVTKYNLRYFVSFKKMDFEKSYFSNLYSLDFWEMENQKFIKDDFIGETIIHIVFEFFKTVKFGRMVFLRNFRRTDPCFICRYFFLTKSNTCRNEKN